MLATIAPAASPVRVSRHARLARLRSAAARAAIVNPRDSSLYADPVVVTDNGTANPHGQTPFLCNKSSLGIWHVTGGVYGDNASGSAIRSGWVDVGRTYASEVNSYGRWEAMADSRYLAVRLLPSNKAYRFLVDGRYISLTGTRLSVTSGTENQYVTLDFGTRRVRRVAIEASHLSGLAGAYVEEGARMWPVEMSSIVHGVFLGDSYVWGAGLTLQADSVAVQMGDRLGIAIQASGSGGTGWNHSNPALYRFDQRIASGDLGLSYFEPEVIFLMASVNDRSSDAPTVTANALAGLKEARRRYPEVPIVVFGAMPIPKGPVSGTPSISSTEEAVKAAVAEFSDPLCRFVPVTTDAQGEWSTGRGSALNFTAPLSDATNATLESNWSQDTSTTSYTILFSDGSTRLGNFTNGSAAVSWSGPVTADATAMVRQTEGNSRYLFTADWTHLNEYGAGYVGERYARAALSALEDMLD
ncbi:SGNH/GDSL hydrolase family protein [Stakelama tenebrarum]|uniref:SGNH/GDSL hydrolase family protein n=1 Tax=Stakelama tenebrarum TaxID=2711215 RepID=A0A6G6Y3J0_9SPHN|nr:SGNH/GDSL hydrolase family protein [Sphingosinithalassobacter tenebrarum]QIG79514.1 SGNH/GDSL hydrolase family protein [Sphingosinithalassobacter tenebrarum]